MAYYETPSRIMRRIEAVEADDMPSLPSIPAFEDSEIQSEGEQSPFETPLQSTPAPTSRKNSASTSATRFANSIARSLTGSRVSATKSHADSFSISPIPHGRQHEEESGETSSVPEIYLPPEEIDELSIADALQSVSPGSSPYSEPAARKPKYVDYFVPLRPEPQPSPFKNVSLRRPLSRARTPSLTRTPLSSDASSVNSTPKSTHFEEMSLPPSPKGSPAIVLHPPEDESEAEHHLSGSQSDAQSMDMTDPHISPVRDLRSELDADSESDEREPTFSSEGEETRAPIASPGALAFTPTPAFPRPRARFDPETPGFATPKQDFEDPLTPHTRRRSFLLSVINSTTRPRLKVGTPHPRNRLAFPETPKTTASSPQSSSDGGTPQPTSLQPAFAGVTPRPRIRAGRLSYPLTHTHTPSDSDNGLSDGAGDRASFISTASSHDLTIHPRANTSFDPAMGFGHGGHGGVGRFNATKLNTYLHGLNRRLQEENETLLDKLKTMEEERSGSTTSGSSSRRTSAGFSRRISAGSSALPNVAEDVGGEGWVEEKAELEAMIDKLKDEAEKYHAEKEEIEKALQDEQEARARDKDRWRERMTDVEEGVKTIVEDLEQKLQAAESRAAEWEKTGTDEIKQLRIQLADAEVLRDDAIERAAASERALQSGKDLDGELRAAQDRVSQVVSDLRNANSQVRDLEQEVLHCEERNDELERDLKEERTLAKDLEKELNSKLDDLDIQRQRIEELEEINQKMGEQLNAAGAYITEVEEQAEAAIERIDSLETESSAAHDRLTKMKASNEATLERMSQLQAEARSASDQMQQMEEALEEAEKKMLDYEAEVGELKAQLERLKERSIRDPSLMNTLDPDVERVEEELNDAYREIARLNAVLNQSPARKAIDKAKDARIELLEKENEELAERIKILRTIHSSESMATPSRGIQNISGISPLHRQVLQVRTPRTPGGPLKDMSWLSAANHDPSVAPLLAEISRLQHELDYANDSIDEKIDKLEEAGLGVVELMARLEDARSKISRLEDEIGRLSRRDDRRTRRLERARCKKCLTKVDLSGLDAEESSLYIAKSNLPDEPPTPPTKTSESLRKELQKANSHLSDMKKEWEDEKRRLLGEKAVLQEAANRLNIQVEDVKSNEARKTGDAKRAVMELEEELKAERSRLRAMSSEQTKVHREKEGILIELQRTESDMEDVRDQLERFKAENRELEKELRLNANVEQKARLLEIKVTENAETITQLREERAMLVTDHKDLQKRFNEITAQANRLREEYSASQKSHNERRLQLDEQLLTITELRRLLTDQQAQQEEVANKNADAEEEKHAVIKQLEADLQRVKKDAEAFGRDLKTLRKEKEKMESKYEEERSRSERKKKQMEAQVRLLNEQLDGHREHVCPSHDDTDLKQQHNRECKGLITQIHYLKAMFTRESTFRIDLSYQKRYLLVLLASFEQSEQTILAAISKIGFPSPPPVPSKRKKRKLKSVVQSIIFLSRIRRSSRDWQKTRSSRKAILDALEAVRRKRVAS